MLDVVVVLLVLAEGEKKLGDVKGDSREKLLVHRQPFPVLGGREVVN